MSPAGSECSRPRALVLPGYPGRLLLALILMVATACGATEASREWRVEAVDTRGVTLLWGNAGLGTPGESEPRSAAVGLPAGSRPAGSLEVLSDTASAHTAKPADATAAGPVLTVSAPARFRDLELATLTLDPRRNGLVLAKARIRVDFRATAGARPAFPPGENTAPERHLKAWILNYAQSRGFRGQPASLAAAKATAGAGAAVSGPSRSALLPRKRLLIHTREELVEVLDHAALRAAGVPVDRIDPRYMRLFHDGIEMPMHIAGGDDGRWNPGDYLEFIGRAARGTTTYNSLYTNSATFILTWDGGRLGLRAPEAPVPVRGQDVFLPAVGDAEAAPPFRAKEHKEADLQILRIGNTSAEGVVDLGARVEASELTDFWMWERQGTGSDSRDIVFNLENAPVPFAGGAPAGAEPLRIRINLKGITNNPKAEPDHHVKFILNGNDISLVEGVANDAVWEGQAFHTWVSRPLNPKVLKQGRNVLTLQKVNDLRGKDGAPVEVQDAYLNWIELEFPSGYAASGDLLRFSNDFEDSLGARLFTLEGFTTRDLTLWDAGGRKLTGYRVVPGSSGFTVSLVDSLAGPTRYIASSLAKRDVPATQLDSLPDLISPTEGADYLVVTGPELLGSALDSLLAHRRGQGLRTRTVLARHIYQAFGDGSMDPAAIRRFVEHAYRTWPRPAPAYLLLLGETSQWYEKASGSLQVTVVPTQLVDIPGWGVAATDDYFAKVSGGDDIPDLYVGRIPVANRTDLSKVVRKILALEARPAGHWANKTLLVSGFEDIFTRQTDRLQALTVARNRQYSRLDLYPKSPYYRGDAGRGGFFSRLDSAFGVVTFVGHGGGAVWSDAGILTLTHLDEKRLTGEYPIPLVSSITCLTGYFEDVADRSLGEEMVRMERTGAAAFYGAAGYISNLAGEALAYEVLAAAAAGGADGTAGAVIHQAETMVQLRTGGDFAPILAEFNLLGDPALRLPTPAASGSLELTPRALAGATTLEARGRDLDPREGEGVMTFFLGDSAVLDSKVRIQQGTFDAKALLAGLKGPVPDGKAVLHYWEGRESRLATAPFTTLDWLIDSVRLEPERAAPGDSVRIRLRLGTAYGKVRVEGGISLYTVAGKDIPPFADDHQAPLRILSGETLESAAFQLPAATAGTAGPNLHVAFRLNVSILDEEGEIAGGIRNASSRTYSLPLSDLARLAFDPVAFRHPIREEAGVWTVFRNSGLGAAEDFSVELLLDAESASPRLLTKAYPGSLPLGGVDSLFFACDDSLLFGKRLRASLSPARPGDLADRRTIQDTVLRIRTRVLASPDDTLRLDSATWVRLVSGAAPRRVFAEARAVPSLPAHLSPASGSPPPQAWLLRSPRMEPRELVLETRLPEIPRGAAKIAMPVASPAWHYQPISIPPILPLPGGSGAGTPSAWLKLDAAASEHAWSAHPFREGLYALFINRDVSPPLIQLSSRGQSLLADDYVPRNTPIDVVVRDAEGIDMALRVPELKSRRQPMDSATLASETTADFPTQARFNFLPKHGASEDSLEVTATDVSGNATRRVLAYRLGDDLSVRNLGSYPNPFADTAVFVYTLTDFCEKVTLKVYSRAGRLVRALEERNVVGYREVVWDGRSQSGARIGNGLYFLKVTAHAKDQESSKVFKLFKKRRK